MPERHPQRSATLGIRGERPYLETDVEIRVLGPLEVAINTAGVQLGGRKQRTVLALLAAEVGKRVSVDALIDGVWGDEPTAGARSTLQTYVSNLRAAIGDIIVRDNDGYRLATDPEHVDAVQFERAVGRAADLVETDPAEASQRLRAALALWRGNPYADLARSFPLEIEARRLEELRLRAVEARIEAELALGHHADLIAELEVRCEEFPVYERFRAQHMLALYRSGRQAEALRAYQKTRTYLAEELGLEPSPQLQEVERRILNHDKSLVLEAEPQVRTVAFLLTDVEDSTVLWELHTAAMRAAVGEHDRIVFGAVETAGGRVVKRVGDGVDIAFADVGAAVAAAGEIQRELAAARWGETDALRVRMAVDLGEVEARGGDYFGPVLNRAGRMLAAAHGGQVLLSADAHAALAATESGWQAKALGEYRFKGIGSPFSVFQLSIDGLPADFPPLRIDRLPPALPAVAFARSVRGYELREEIGGGAFGIVYRAYQPSVGREVAIKIIRSELVNQPSFVRRFEAEARLVAQLEHPHIVSLYDYWRDPDGAYLVMRWLRGGSLRKALERGPWNIGPAVELLTQICGALSYAHRQGVIHGDLKPANVLLDDERHAYLSDFGIATRLADPSDAELFANSSPAYLSPEELEGEERTARSDIYSLGLLTYELLTGRRPPMDGVLPSVTTVGAVVPVAVDSVIAQATATDPAERYATAEAFLAAFGRACGAIAPAPVSVYTAVDNPYKGLHSFGEADQGDFYGRESLVSELAAVVAEHRLVAVVGPSGIGKSSVVRAGLIPALRDGGLPGSQTWVISDMFPGSYPYEELAAALLRVAVDRPEQIAEELARDELGIRRMAKRMLPPDSELLLVIDQFEELFTLTTDEEIRRRFLDSLTELAADSRARVRVVVTMRADFLDYPLRYPEFGELFKAGIVAVTIPSDDDLAAAIEGPAAAAGVRFEPGLVSRIIADVRDQPGGLPLLQYALTELFAARPTDLLTAHTYETTGGVVGALATRAEELWEQLDERGRAAARHVFLRLITVDAGGQDTRRRVRRRELRQLELDAPAVDQLLRRYGEHRLLTFDRDPLTRSPTVEIAHEALLAQWKRLAAWVDERRDDLVLHRRLLEAVAEWGDAGRQTDYLPREGRLAQFEDWAATTDLALSSDEKAFLELGRRQEDEHRAGAARRRRAMLVGFALAAVVAAVLAGLALVGREHAKRNAQVATSRELAASAVSVLDRDPELSVLLSLQAAEAVKPTFEAVSALHEALQQDRALWTLQRRLQKLPNGVASPDWGSLSPDGHLLLVGAVDGLEVWNVERHERLWKIRLAHGDVPLARFSSDGSSVVGTTVWAPASSPPPAGVRPGVHVWDALTGREIQYRPIGPCPAFGISQYGSFVDLSRPFALYAVKATGSDSRRCDSGPLEMFLFDVGTGARRPVTTQSEGLPPDILGLNGMATSADSRYVAISGVARTWVVDTQTHREVFSRNVDGPDWVALSADGRRVVTGGGSVVPLSLWDVASGRLLRQFDTKQVFWFGFSRDERTLASFGRDGVVRLWDVATGHETTSLRGHAAGGTWASLSSDGTRLASFAGDDSVRVWTLHARGEVATFPLGAGFYAGGSLDIAGGRAAVEVLHVGSPVDAVGQRARGIVFDPSTGAVQTRIPGVTGQVIRLSPDGRQLAAQQQVAAPTLSRAPVDGPVLVHDLATRRVTSLEGFCVYSEAVSAANPQCKKAPGTPFKAWVFSMEFSADGSLLAVGSAHGGGLSVWNTKTGKLLFHTDPPSDDLWTVGFSPDGRRLVARTLNELIVYDTGSWQRIVRRSFGAVGVRFSPDGKYLVGGSTTGGNGVEIVDAGTWRRRATLVGLQGQLKSLDISPDGTTIASADFSGLVRIWDLRSGKALQDVPFANVPIQNAKFLDDRHLLVTPANGPEVFIVTLDVDELLRIARSRLTRGFTQEECRTYLHVDSCPSS
jgi:WD40 repeat protein/DNA-binding SARP family transcriptional activator/tRNA A-37 threonylcarbamoyl transferase component Bud32